MLLHAGGPIDEASIGPDITPAAVEAAGWTSAANTDQVLFEAQSVVASGKVYLFGGFYNTRIQVTQEIHSFDPSTNVWENAGTTPAPETHPGFATDGRMVYFVGGFRGDWKGPFSAATHDFWMFDSAANVWKRGPNLPDFRAAGGLALVGRSLHFMGGMEMGVQGDSADHWALDLDNPIAGWKRKADMPNPRNHIGVTALDGKIYVVGGQHLLDEAYGIDTGVDAYDVATDTWTAVASLPVNRSHLHNSTFTYTGKLYSVGGTDLGNIASSEVLSYDPTANAWSLVGHLPAARSATAATIFGDTLIVSTGTPTGVNPQSTTWTRSLATPWPIPSVPGDGAGTVPVDSAALEPGGAIPAANGLLACFTNSPSGPVVGGTKGRITVKLANTGTEKIRGKRAVELFLSTDGVLDSADTNLATQSKTLSLKAGKSQSLSLKFKYPDQLSGTYFVLAKADLADPEARVLADQSLAASAELVTIAPPFVDLTGQLEVSTKPIAPGRRTSLVLTLQNTGNTTLKGKVTSTYDAAMAGVLPGVQTSLRSSLHSVRIDPGKTKRFRVSVRLPEEIVAGTYDVRSILSLDGDFPDVSQENNLVPGSSQWVVA